MNPERIKQERKKFEARLHARWTAWLARAVKAEKELAALREPQACGHPRACLETKEISVEVSVPVSREMALDAGDPALEGTPYPLTQTQTIEVCSACEREQEAVKRAVEEMNERCAYIGAAYSSSTARAIRSLITVGGKEPTCSE